MSKSKPNHFLAYALIGLFVLIGIGFSLVVPPFETPDEIYHYAFARHLAQGNALPVQNHQVNGPWEQEGSQAPLYYLLVAGLTAAIDQNDFEAIAIYNPNANIGSPFVAGNKNRMLYSARSLPLRKTNLALHIGRWLSVMFGAITLWSVYQSALLVFVKRRYLALASLLFLAMIPQFGFISASFSNDALITTLCSAVVYWLAYLIAKSEKLNPFRAWHWLFLGGLLGLAGLSKLQGLGLIPLAGLTLLLLAWRTGDWRTLLVRIVWVALPALLIAGWWYWRNFMLYADWLGTSNLKAINGERSTPLTLASFWSEFRGVRYSFWGLFGWFSIPLPILFYTALDALSVIGLFGGIGALLRQKKSNALFMLLIGWVVIGFALMLYWMSDAMGGQGRLLFPAIGAIVILLVAGIDQLVRWKLAVFLPSLGLAVALLYTLFWLLPTAYQPPSPVAHVPDSAKSLNVHFVNPDEPGLELQLLAMDAPAERLRFEDEIPITLYLRSNQAAQNDYPLFIQMLDTDGSAVANLTSHPGWGRNPTTLWQPSQIYGDSYQLQLVQTTELQLPARLRIYAGFVKPGTEAQGSLPLGAYTSKGREITPFVGEIVVESAQPQEQQASAKMAINGAIFGNVIQLARSSAPSEVTIGQVNTFTVSLLWQATGTPATDYTAFVHLLSKAGQPLVGSDHPPAGERLPTSFWQKEDQILDLHNFTLPQSTPTGVYDIWVGFYETASNGTLRLPISDAAGQIAGDGVILIGTITVN